MFKGIILNGVAGGLAEKQRTSGAHRIASHLRKHGWDIEVLDFCGYLSQRQIEDFLLTRVDINTKFVGFSKLFSEWTEKDENVAAFVKKINPDICTIYGGQVHQVHHYFRAKSLDYCVSGYGENAIIELLKYLFSNGAKPRLKDFTYYKLLNSNRDYPAVPYTRPDTIYEDRDFIFPNEKIAIETSRGCKFKCAFCNFPFLGVKGDWTRDADSFEYQIKDIYDRFGVTEFVITDETFNDNITKIRKYADVVEKMNFNPYFSGFIRADLLVQRKYDKEELARMNFVGQYYGIETFNPKSAKLIGKGLNPEILKPKLLDAQDYFLKQFGRLHNGTISMIIGLPEDTEKDVLDAAKWIRDNWRGTSVHFVLEIAKRNESNTESIFTKNFEKYGYEVMTKEEINFYTKKYKNLRYHRQAMRGPRHQIAWKNKHMNLIKANSLYFEIIDNYTSLRADNFYQFGRHALIDDSIMDSYYLKKINYVFS